MSRGRVALVALGCAKNQVEAESLSSRLAREGWELTADIPNANLVVVHSCGFLEAARREARETLSSVRRASPRSFVVLTGCFAQFLNGKKIPGVSAVLGTGQLDRLPEVMARLEEGPAPKIPAASPAGYHDASLPRPLRPGQLSAYLRIAEGCDHRCAFCLIPQLRGPLRSRPVSDILAEAGGLTSRGVRELVLISQDTTAYGSDRRGLRLAGLLRRLLADGRARWIRLLYAYPSEVDDELISLLAGEPKLVRYLDMPLQHFSDGMLAAMGRDWGQAKTRALIDRLADKVPNLALRTTFIVGFPGETEKDFKEMLALARTGVFEHVGVFPYSFEARSPSARLPGQVPPEVVEERWQRLLDAHRDAKKRRDVGRRGRRLEVLVERGLDGNWRARASHQAPEVDGGVRLDRWPERPGFYRAEITGTEGIDLTATLMNAKMTPGGVR